MNPFNLTLETSVLSVISVSAVFNFPDVLLSKATKIWTFFNRRHFGLFIAENAQVEPITLTMTQFDPTVFQ